MEKPDFAQLFAVPPVFGCSDFSVMARKNENGRLRIGFAIARRNIKRAVTRNRHKRVVRAWFFTRRRRFAGLDVAIVVRKSFVESNRWQTRAEQIGTRLMKLLQK